MVSIIIMTDDVLVIFILYFSKLFLQGLLEIFFQFVKVYRRCKQRIHRILFLMKEKSPYERGRDKRSYLLDCVINMVIHRKNIICRWRMVYKEMMAIVASGFIDEREKERSDYLNVSRWVQDQGGRKTMAIFIPGFKCVRMWLWEECVKRSEFSFSNPTAAPLVIEESRDDQVCPTEATWWCQIKRCKRKAGRKELLPLILCPLVPSFRIRHQAARALLMGGW